jgi:hypothetical protein
MGIAMKDYTQKERYERAKKKVDNMKGFYGHFAGYLIVNIFISSNKIIRNLNSGESFSEAFFDFGTFSLWFFWGIGVFFHFYGVFGKEYIFSKNWEQRKIAEFIEKEKTLDNKKQ